MLNLFRRKKQDAPTWRQWYAIPTRGEKAPDWIEWLRTQHKPIEGEFFPRAEVPPWIMASDLLGGEKLAPILAECRGVASLRTSYEADPNPSRRQQLFLSVAQLACSFAQREAGVISIIPAMRTYLADEWLPTLNEFRVLDHYIIHQVYEGDGPQWIHSHGLVQFGIPEVEVRDVPPALAAAAGHFVEMMQEWMMRGEPFADGHTMEAPGHPEIWAVAESIRAADNEDHGEPDYPLLRFSDLDPATKGRGVGLTRFLSALTSG